MRQRKSTEAAAAGHPVRAALMRLALSVGLVLLVMLAGGALVLYARHCQRQLGVGAVEGPVLSATTAWGDDWGRTGRFDARVAFTDFAAAEGEATVSLTWDDGWFSGDPATYQPEFAYAGSVLAALAYAESGYYQADTDCLPYMELGLSALGFSDISTASYRYRSEVVDEALSLVTQEADGAAYGIAEKSISSGNGEERRLIVVSIRGSYGSEWLSNLNVMGDEDHPGYESAAGEIALALRDRIDRAHGEGLGVELLLVGHSRGGAIANLVAARADDELAGDPSGDSIGLAEGDRVRAYTYASPATTLVADAHGARYANIFNIANPSDIMTHLPLATWGYQRYGVDVSLPSVGDADFADKHGAMEQVFRETMGTESPYHPEDELLIEGIVTDIGSQVETLDELLTPAGVTAAISTVALRVNPWEMLYAHYPSVYIAWLATLC